MFGLFLAQSDGISISRVITVVSIVLSMVSLGIAFWKARAFLPLRPVFDYARLAVQLVAVVAMAWLSGVSTAPALLLGAALLGGGLGYFQGSSLEVAVDEGVVRLRRSIVGVGIWGAGLILMQVAGLANRAGVVRLGQAIAWFSIGLGVGLLIGREPRIRGAVRATGAAVGVVVLILSSVGILAVSEAAPAAAQSGCPAPPNGWQERATESEGVCSYESTFGDTAAISESGGRKCGAELAEHWAGFPGSPGAGSNVNIRNDGTSGFEKWLVLTPNAVISIAASNVPGPGTVERFVPAANEFARIRYASCGGASPTTTAGGGTNPPQTTAAPRTTIVTETFPDDPPPVATIVDEGVALTSTTVAPTTQAPSTSDPVEQTTEAPVVASSTTSSTMTTSTTIGSGDQVALPPVGGGDDVDQGEDDVTQDEAVQQAVAGFLLAGLLGLISWAEAFQAIDSISGSAPGTAQATHGHLQTQFPDNKAPAPPSSSPNAPVPPKPPVPPGGTTPASSYLPQTPPGPGAGGTPSNGPGRRSWYPPDNQAGEGGSATSSPREPSGTPTGADAGQDSGSGTSFEDWGLGELEQQQLDPNGAPPVTQQGGMGGPGVRLTDRDGDGEYDFGEYDDDNDGTFDRSGPLGADGRPEFPPEPAEPHVFGSEDGPHTTLRDTDGDGIYDRFDHDADGDGTPDTSGRLERRDGDVFLVPDGDELPRPSTPDGGEVSPPPTPDPFLDPLLDALGDGPDLGPAPAEPMEVDVGGHRTRVTDRDRDGEYDFVEADVDGDGEFDASGRLVPDGEGGHTFVPEGGVEEVAADGLDDEDSDTDFDAGGDTSGGPEPLTRREIEDLWRWGLERGRSLEDIREDIDGLQQARGLDVPAEDPFRLGPTETSAGHVPMTPGEAAHHRDLQNQLAELTRQREDFDAKWRQLQEDRGRATRRELNAEMRQMATALEVWEAESDIRSRMAAEQEWIRVYKMWRAGDTFMDAPDGTSFYAADSPGRQELTEAIHQRGLEIDRIERERIRAIEAAQRRGRPSDELDVLDRVQDDLLDARRRLDQQIDGVQGEINVYESFADGRPLPKR